MGADSLSLQFNLAQGLANCSRVLYKIAYSEDELHDILSQALEYLRRAVHASRAYLFENFTDPELGLCMGMRVEVCAPAVHPQIGYPQNRRMPWSKLPPEMSQLLAAGKAFGGPVDSAFASRPEWITIFRNQQPDPLLSVQQFPIHIDGRWWGFIGFDDVESPREWSRSEIMLLQVAAEIIGYTLHRWQIHSSLQRELTERRRQEERLRLLESVAVNMAEGVIITSAHTLDSPGPHILYVNEAFTRITGYEAKEVIGKNPRILQGPDTSRMELDRLRSALVRQEAVDLELLNYRKDGTAFWFEMSIVPVFDDEGACTHFVAVQRDITSRKQAQASLQEAKQELENRVAQRTSQILSVNERLRSEIISRQQAEAEVRNRLAVEQKLASISARLFDESEPWEVLPAILRDIGGMVNSARIALVFLEDEGGVVGEIHEWCSPDIAPLDLTLLTSAKSVLPWMRDQFKEHHYVYIEDVQQMSSTTANIKQIIQEFDIHSFAAFPLMIDEKLAAILISLNFVSEFGELKRKLDVLKVIAGLLGSMLRRDALLNFLEQRAIDRTRELSALFEMTMLAAEAEDLSDMLGPAVSQIMDVVRCQAISLYELSDDRKSLELIAQFGLNREANSQTEPLTESFSHWFDDFNQPIIEHKPSKAKWLPVALRPDGYGVYIGAQLRARGKAIGILNCYQWEEGAYSLNTTAILVALAEHLGIIIENYRLRQLAEEGAIIEERQRLARELHDAVAQSLYGITLFARSGVDALEESNFSKVAETMTEIELNGLGALKEMRLMLHQLQPLALEQGGLVRAIEKRLNQVERRLGIEAKLTIDNDNGFHLQSHVEETLYRIVTEALNNSLRHSDATGVTVLLKENYAVLQLKVQDNGRGFDTSSQRLGMGMKNMKERAETLQGEVTVTSSLGEGTIIEVDIPIERLEQVN